MSAEWRQRYLQNRDAILSYLEMMEERQELGKDAAVRAGVNAMVRLVRDFGCSREQYFDAAKGGYDWEGAQEADRVLSAALKAGCNLGELVSEVVVNGKVDLARVETVISDFAAGRPGCSPEQRESALESMERQPLGAPIEIPGETLSEAEVARVKAGRHSRAIGVFEEFPAWVLAAYPSLCCWATTGSLARVMLGQLDSATLRRKQSASAGGRGVLSTFNSITESFYNECRDSLRQEVRAGSAPRRSTILVKIARISLTCCIGCGLKRC